MKIVDIHEARKHLSKLVDKAAKGESFIIAKSGRPVAKITAIDTYANGKKRRLGFLAGTFSVPADFDEMGTTAIEQMFGTRDEGV